jgi:hypothetical protein
MLIYDYIIVGAGPSGLALAQCCSRNGERILIIDRESTIGGCHRVRRVKYTNPRGDDEMVFTEHGPRIYSDTYAVFKELLKEMKVDFYKLFKKYRFNILEIGGETLYSVLSYKEMGHLALSFLYLSFDDTYGESINLYNYLVQNQFSEKSTEMIDRMCKLSDGGGHHKFTLHEFLQLMNQQFLYSLYQPTKPNDVGLFKIWYDFLKSRNVEFLFNSTIKNINTNVITNTVEFVTIKSVNTGDLDIYTKNLILAIPPKSLYNLLIKENDIIKNSFGSDLEQFSQETAYIEYISITFHWNTHLNLKKIYGFPKSTWGVAFVLLSDYMKFDQDVSKTVISAAVTIPDKKSPTINKTANECTKDELIAEVFNQLKLAYGDDLITPTLSVLSPGVSYDSNKKSWVSYDTAFIASNKYTPLPFKSKTVPNLYTLGTHNGKSLYKFTSLEAAVSNAVVLSKEFNKNQQLPGHNLSRTFYISDILRVIYLILIMYILYLIVKYSKLKKR